MLAVIMYLLSYLIMIKEGHTIVLVPKDSGTIIADSTTSIIITVNAYFTLK